MKILRHPESYSDMLTRIFVASSVIGAGCVFVIASVSPQAESLLSSLNVEADVWVFKAIKALYVLIPLGLAVLARIFVLHDKISDALGIRTRFDIEHILKPLAAAVRFPTSGARWERILANHDQTMNRTFYQYCSFSAPKIDQHLVRTAADRWGWFWCAIEPQAILLVTAIILTSVGALAAFFGTVVFMLLLGIVAVLLWPSLVRGAQLQVAEVLRSEAWRADILSAFNAVSPE